MSYCVNCGVELAPDAGRCPLCDCPVLNPLQRKNELKPSAYPRERERAEHYAQRRFTVVVITVVCLFAASICLMIDLFFAGALTWSRYVAASVALVWVAVSIPLIRFRIGPIRITLAELLSAALYVYLIERWTAPGMWYANLALPIIGVIGLAALVTTALLRFKLIKGLDIAALLSFDAGILVVCIEVLVEGYLSSFTKLTWGWLAFIPCAAASVLLMVIERRQGVKHALAKRFHI